MQRDLLILLIFRPNYGGSRCTGSGFRAIMCKKDVAGLNFINKSVLIMSILRNVSTASPLMLMQHKSA